VQTALVIDDDGVWRRIFYDYLTEKGFKVYTAYDGLEGLSKAMKYKPDVIIVDYLLPKVNGSYVIRFLRANDAFKNAGVVLTSFTDDMINEYWAKEYGADLFIKKADGIEAVKSKLDNFLIVNFEADKSKTIEINTASIQTLMEVIDEDLRKERINRDILELVKKVDDEVYVIRKLWNMLTNFAEIGVMYILLISPSMGRVYAFSKSMAGVNPKEVRDELLNLLNKPTTPSDWEWYGNVNYHAKDPIKVEFSFYNLIEIDGEEIGVIAYSGLNDAERKKIITLSKDIQDSLKVLFRTLNLFWDYKIAADVDSLTGLLVKKIILLKVEEYAKLATRQRLKFSLAMMDIDDFKKVNDTYGHVTGDEVLKRVGKIISSTIRDTDLAGRYGGEEFLILMPATEIDAAKKAIERVLENIRNYNWKELGIEKVTMSAGVAQAVPGKSVTELIEMADKALYQAKRSGKDRCVAYGGED